MGMCIGEKRKLIVPPNLAYGEEGVGDKIPGDSTLVFRVELLDIIKEPPVAGRKPKRPDHELLQVEVLKTVSKRKCTVITYPG